MCARLTLSRKLRRVDPPYRRSPAMHRDVSQTHQMGLVSLYNRPVRYLGQVKSIGPIQAAAIFAHTDSACGCYGSAMQRASFEDGCG